MSAIAALKGYRTQFVYSLYHILMHEGQGFRFKLEGEEDLDVLDKEGRLLSVIQIKNLSSAVTVSDLLQDGKTSFIRRFIDKYPQSEPVLVSFGPVSAELKNWQKQKTLFLQKGRTCSKSTG